MIRLLRLLLSLLGAPDADCRAAIYATPGDRTAGGRVACPPHHWPQRLHGVAHRSLPCGTLLLLEHAGRWTLAPVVDRGPYGRRSDGRWSSCLDLAPSVARHLGATGSSRVRWWRLGR